VCAIYSMDMRRRPVADCCETKVAGCVVHVCSCIFWLALSPHTDGEVCFLFISFSSWTRPVGIAKVSLIELDKL
jgi:hypothetical protein